MRLGYLVSQYPAVSHTFILREILGLRRCGFEIETFSVNGPDQVAAKLSQEEKEEISKTYYLKRSAFRDLFFAHFFSLIQRPCGYFRGISEAMNLAGLSLGRLLWHFFYFGEAVLLGWELVRRDLNHVHVHFANPAASVALIASRVFPLSYSMTVHGPTDFESTKRNNLSEKIAGAKFVICISIFSKKKLLSGAPFGQEGKAAVIPLGVDPEEFGPGEFRDAPSVFEILCVGRLVPAKGQKYLLRALKILTAKGRHIKTRFVGEGPDRQALEREVKNLGLDSMVFFEGAQGQGVVKQRLLYADLFVLPSKNEGVPVSLMEAMAMGVPCISTPVAGIPELIDDGKNGILVPPADERSLAEAIEKLILDAAFRKNIGREGRKKILEKYDLKKNIEKKALFFKEELFSEHPGS